MQSSLTFQEHGSAATAATPPRVKRCFSASAKSTSSTQAPLSPTTQPIAVTPISPLSAHSKNSKITPVRFSNVANYWKQRARGCDPSPVPDLHASGQNHAFILAPPPGNEIAPHGIPGISLQSDLVAVSEHQDDDARQLAPNNCDSCGPTPLRLINLLEDDSPGPSVSECGRAFSACTSSPAAPPRRRFTRMPSTPEHTPATHAPSNMSIMSIATPEKIDAASLDGTWDAESEMELALDLVNHVPCNMMDRISDLLHSPHVLPGDSEGRSVSRALCFSPHAGQKPRFHLSTSCLPRPTSSSCAMLALMCLTFVAGFAARGVYDTQTHSLEHVPTVSIMSAAEGLWRRRRTPRHSQNSDDCLISALHESHMYEMDERKNASIPKASVVDHARHASFSRDTAGYCAAPHAPENPDIDKAWLYLQADDRDEDMCRHSDSIFLLGESSHRQSMRQHLNNLSQALLNEVPRTAVIEQGQTLITNRNQTVDAKEAGNSSPFFVEGLLWTHSQGSSADSNDQEFWDIQDPVGDCLRAVDAWRRSRMNASMNLSNGGLFAEQACHAFQLDHFVYAEI